MSGEVGDRLLYGAGAERGCTLLVAKPQANAG